MLISALSLQLVEDGAEPGLEDLGREGLPARHPHQHSLSGTVPYVSHAA